MKKIFKFIGTLLFLGFLFSIAVLMKIVMEFKQKKGKSVIFNGIDKRYKEELPEEKDYNLLFSGINFDFSQLENLPKELELNFTGMFCGINIRIPAEWNVELTGTQDKCGINNPTEETENPPTILKINYDLKFAGLNIEPVKV